jgi:glycosyltransferase domain-containing protein
MASDLAILIPTYNRPLLLKRALQYLAGRRCAYPVFVADSSGQNSANLEVIAAVSDALNITYQHYNVDFYPKITQALNTIQTRYVVLCADDDFLIPNALGKCVDFLETHSDYAVVHGLEVVISRIPQPPGILTRSYPQRTIDDESPITRLKNHLSSYTPTIYGVHRRNEMLDNFQRVSASTKDYGFGEILETVLTLIDGKRRSLTGLYNVRENSGNAAHHATKSVFLPGTLSTAEFNERYSSFRMAAAQALAEKEGISTGEAEASLHQAFKCYLDFYARRQKRSLTYHFEDEVYTARPDAAVVRMRKKVASGRSLVQTALSRGKLVELFLSPQKTALHLKEDARDDALTLQRLLAEPFREDFLPVYKAYEA